MFLVFFDLDDCCDVRPKREQVADNDGGRHDFSCGGDRLDCLCGCCQLVCRCDLLGIGEALDVGNRLFDGEELLLRHNVIPEFCRRRFVQCWIELQVLVGRHRRCPELAVCPFGGIHTFVKQRYGLRHAKSKKSRCLQQKSCLAHHIGRFSGIALFREGVLAVKCDIHNLCDHCDGMQR